MHILPQPWTLVDHPTMQGLPTFESEPLHSSPLAAHAISAAATASVVMASISVPTSRHQTISVRIHLCPCRFLNLIVLTASWSKCFPSPLPCAFSLLSPLVPSRFRVAPMFLLRLMPVNLGCIPVPFQASSPRSPRCWRSFISAHCTCCIATRNATQEHSTRYLEFVFSSTAHVSLGVVGAASLVAYTCHSYLYFSAVQQPGGGWLIHVGI